MVRRGCRPRSYSQTQPEQIADWRAVSLARRLAPCQSVHWLRDAYVPRSMVELHTRQEKIKKSNANYNGNTSTKQKHPHDITSSPSKKSENRKPDNCTNN